MSDSEGLKSMDWMEGQGDWRAGNMEKWIWWKQGQRKDLKIEKGYGQRHSQYKGRVECHW